MRERATPLLARVLYWLLGAPVVCLAVLYVGLVPVLFLGPAENRSPITSLVVVPYGAVLIVASLYLSWACWRAVRGDPPTTAFRPFPRAVWLATIAVGLTLGLIEFARAA